MHTTHVILVNLEYAKLTKESEIIHYAEIVTSGYQYTVFDWRTVEDVILGSSEPEKLLELLNQCRNAQQKQINDYLEFLNKNLGDNLSQIVSSLFNKRDYSLSNPLKGLAKLLDGEYTFDSGFFDTEWHTSRIDEDTLQTIRKSPENYALVLFDYHN